MFYSLRPLQGGDEHPDYSFRKSEKLSPPWRACPDEGGRPQGAELKQ